MASGTLTPSKLCTNIVFTPETKKKTCIVCGKKEGTAKYRFKLFKRNSCKKSKAGTLIEECLDIEISQSQNVDTVCHNCYRSVSNLQSRWRGFKESYEKTVEKLKLSHGQVTCSETKTRLPCNVLSAESKKIQVAKPAAVPSKVSTSLNFNCMH